MKMKMLIIALGCSVFVGGIGYLSNTLSRRCCYRIVVPHLLSKIPAHEPYYSRDDSTDKDAAAALDEFGRERTRLCRKTLGSHDYPRVKLASSVYVPFLVSVHHLWERQPLVGDGGTTVFVSLFGLCWKIGEI